jgi:hypothetical protein
VTKLSTGNFHFNGLPLKGKIVMHIQNQLYG